MLAGCSSAGGIRPNPHGATIPSLGSVDSSLRDRFRQVDVLHKQHVGLDHLSFVVDDEMRAHRAIAGMRRPAQRAIVKGRGVHDLPLFGPVSF